MSSVSSSPAACYFPRNMLNTIREIQNMIFWEIYVISILITVSMLFPHSLTGCCQTAAKHQIDSVQLLLISEQPGFSEQIQFWEEIYLLLCKCSFFWTNRLTFGEHICLKQECWNFDLLKVFSSSEVFTIVIVMIIHSAVKVGKFFYHGWVNLI